MKKNRVVKVLKGIAIAVVAGAAVGLVVMSLWNWLMPALFGLRLITFWQALGLFLLGKLLFGGFRGRPGCGGHWRKRMKERWELMTPEERERFLQGMKGRCGGFVPPAPPA